MRTRGFLQRSWLALAVILLSAAAGRAADRCPGFGGDAAFDALMAELSSDSACQHAVATLHDCAWGSSADTSFAPIVVKTCERGFLAKLTPVAEANYGKRMQICAYREARQGGTMYMSAAALCQADVAAAFAANPAMADVPVRASFDCAGARSPLERAICGDDRLGQADIVLADAYKGALSLAGADNRSKVVASERRWLASLEAACRLGPGDAPTKAATACATTAFEKRFTMLDACQDEPDCLDGHDEVVPIAAATPRASFDCQAPSSALEIAICTDADLGQADIRLAAAYRDATAAVGDAGRAALVSSQRRWLAFVPAACPLGAIGGIPSVWARGCVRSALETRTAQLETCSKGIAGQRAACLDDFRVVTRPAVQP